MRGHARDPRHMPHVLSANGWAATRWERWTGLDPATSNWGMEVLDTSERSQRRSRPRSRPGAAAQSMARRLYCMRGAVWIVRHKPIVCGTDSRRSGACGARLGFGLRDARRCPVHAKATVRARGRAASLRAETLDRRARASSRSPWVVRCDPGQKPRELLEIGSGVDIKPLARGREHQSGHSRLLCWRQMVVAVDPHELLEPVAAAVDDAPILGLVHETEASRQQANRVSRRHPPLASQTVASRSARPCCSESRTAPGATYW